MSTLDTVGFDPLTGIPSADLVSQLANELFLDTPVSPAELAVPAVAPSAPALPGGGPAAPVAGSPPTFGDAPWDAAIGSAPALPAIGGGPYAATGGVPATGGLPMFGESPSASTWPSPGAAPTSQPGAVPAVGDGGFLRDLPHDVDLGFPRDATAPAGEADALGIGLDLAGARGVPAESATPFYFLPAPDLPAASPEEPARFDVHAVRRDFPALHQKVHGKPLIWLDNAATTHKPQSVIDAVSHFYAHDNSNIHRGAHTLAARATDAYEGAREKVRALLGARSSAEIIYTRGTTESINLVAQSYGRTFVGPGDEVIVSTLEHHSNIVPWQFLVRERGATLRVIPIDDAGQVDLAAYERLLNPRTKLVAVAHVSNVLGTVLPISVMTQMAHQHGARLLVDGAQGAPHLPVNVQALDADFYVFSGHKLFAPTGIGILYSKEELLEAMPPWQGGGSMIDAVSFEETTFSALPAKFEAGTPHIAGAVGLGAAVDYVQRFGLQSIAAYEEGLMTYATAALNTVPGLRQIGTTPGKVGALAFDIPGVDSEELGKRLDREGIAVRAGHHCAQPTLARYGLKTAVRPSISLYNTAEEIDVLVAALQKAVRER
jgi:cysteine desulfurase/selenocysteine lyase